MLWSGSSAGCLWVQPGCGIFVQLICNSESMQSDSKQLMQTAVTHSWKISGHLSQLGRTESEHQQQQRHHVH